jgi:hypothetical protein
VILWPEDIDERLRAAKSQAILPNDASVPVPHEGNQLVRLFRHGWLSCMRHRYGIRYIPALFLVGHGAGMKNREIEIGLGTFCFLFMGTLTLALMGIAWLINEGFKAVSQ